MSRNLTDAAMGNARETDVWLQGQGWRVFSAFECESRLAEEEKQTWVDEHGKAFTKSGLPTPITL